MSLDNKTYDRAKWITLVFLPALAAFVGGLAEANIIPDSQQIVSLINLATAFLGSLLQVSSHNYHNTPKGGSHIHASLVPA